MPLNYKKYVRQCANSYKSELRPIYLVRYQTDKYLEPESHRELELGPTCSDCQTTQHRAHRLITNHSMLSVHIQ